jgi:PAS domain S-box-containing protein
VTETGGAQPAAQGYLEFAKALGRAMGQMSLYGAQHPSVGEAAQSAFESLNALLDEHGDELTLSIDQANVLGNGTVLFGADKLPSALSGALSRFHISGITFRRGATAEELKSFCELSLVRQDKLRDFKIADFLAEKNVAHVALNAAIYARVERGQKVVKESEAGGGPGGGAGAPAASADSIVKKLSGKSLEESLEVLISELNINEEERRHVRETVLNQINQELEGRVHKATQSLRKEKQEVENRGARANSVMESGADGVVVVDAGGKILMMNSAAEDIFGRKLSDLAGRPISEIGQENQMLALSGELSTPSDKPIDAKVSVLGKEDDVRTLKHSSAVIKNAGGDIVGSTMVPLDIAKLREYDRMQKEFVANVTHELRSPLTSINAALQMLDSELTGISKDHKNFLNTAVRNVQRLNSIINDILDFSKLQSGRLVVHPEPCDAQEIAAEAVDAMRAWAKSKNIALDCSGSAGGMLVLADKQRTVQVLVNLISNAIKFTPDAGSIKVSLGLETRGNAEHMRFSVKDTGPGIAQQDQGRIFERFVQIAAGEKVGGTGLGLPITKALVVMQNGYIDLDSAPGKGSCFKVFLPAVPALHGEELSAPPVATAQTGKKWWRKIFGR